MEWRSIVTLVCLSGFTTLTNACSPSSDDTIGLIRAGDARACSTPEVKRRLQSRLTPYLSYGIRLRREAKRFGFVFDPVIATSKEGEFVQCAASAYLSFDGKTPAASNRIELNYSLAANLNSPNDFVVQGDFTDQEREALTYYQNLGVIEAAPD